MILTALKMPPGASHRQTSPNPPLPRRSSSRYPAIGSAWLSNRTDIVGPGVGSIRRSRKRSGPGRPALPARHDPGDVGPGVRGVVGGELGVVGVAGVAADLG